jgi:hypothetical protein
MAERSPGFPKLSQSRTNSIRKPIMAFEKTLNTIGSIPYEWKTYSVDNVDKKEKLKNFDLINFTINPERTLRLEVFVKKNAIKLVQRFLENGQLKWDKSFSLPDGQEVFGMNWSEENTVIIASRGPQGNVSFFEINEQGPVSATKKINTKLLSRLTHARTINLNNETYLLVWDDYFLHQWPYQSEKKNTSLKPVSFQGEKIVSVFNDRNQIYAWTQNKQKLKLWKVDGDESFFIKKSELEFDEPTLLPLSKESFLTLDNEKKLWLRLFKKGGELKEKLPGLTSLFDKNDVHIQNNTEGDILVLWGYEDKSQLFHEFKFYLEGLSDDK